MVALLRTGGRPWVEYAELVEERGSAVAVLDDELIRPPDPTSSRARSNAHPDLSDDPPAGTTPSRAQPAAGL